MDASSLYEKLPHGFDTNHSRCGKPEVKLTVHSCRVGAVLFSKAPSIIIMLDSTRHLAVALSVTALLMKRYINYNMWSRAANYLRTNSTMYSVVARKKPASSSPTDLPELTLGVRLITRSGSPSLTSREMTRRRDSLARSRLARIVPGS